MKSFSQRIGITSIKTKMQIESIDDDLKNRLWNSFLTVYWSEAVRLLRRGYLYRIDDNRNKKFSARNYGMSFLKKTLKVYQTLGRLWRKNY